MSLKKNLTIILIAAVVISFLGSVTSVQALETTTITIAPSSNNPVANQPFTLSGTLKAGTTPLSKSIVLYRVNTANQWTQVNTTTTDANGAYTFTRSDPPGLCYYYAVFNGDATYVKSVASCWVTPTVGQ
jgi:hypothetical protein